MHWPRNVAGLGSTESGVGQKSRVESAETEVASSQEEVREAKRHLKRFGEKYQVIDDDLDEASVDVDVLLVDTDDEKDGDDGASNSILAIGFRSS